MIPQRHARPGDTRMESWNEHMLHEFHVYKLVTSPLGTWPVKDHEKLSTFRVFVVSLLQIGMIYTLLNDLIESQLGNMDTVIDHIGLVNCGFLALLKIVLIRRHRQQLSKIIEHAATDWSIVKVDGYRRIMLNYADLGRFIFFFQIVFSYFTTVAMILTPLTIPDATFLENGTLEMGNATLLRSKLLPMGTFCVYRGHEDSLCKTLYSVQAIQLMTTCTGNLGTDVFLYGLSFHLCGQFEVLGHLMSQLGKDLKIIQERRRMVELIRRHSLLLKLADKIEDTSRIILLMQLFLNALHICLIAIIDVSDADECLCMKRQFVLAYTVFTYNTLNVLVYSVGFQLIVHLRMHNYVLLTRIATSFTVLMTQLFLYCYMGECLSSRIEAISRSVYLSDWYNLPPKTVKDFCFIIARAGVPFRITAGRFYHMNLHNFKQILKASASYISVLQLIFEG